MGDKQLRDHLVFAKRRGPTKAMREALAQATHAELGQAKHQLETVWMDATWYETAGCLCGPMQTGQKVQHKKATRPVARRGTSSNG